MITKECPDCADKIEMPDDTMVGEVVSCKSCGEDWEIASVSFDMVKAERISEDWGE